MAGCRVSVRVLRADHKRAAAQLHVLACRVEVRAGDLTRAADANVVRRAGADAAHVPVGVQIEPAAGMVDVRRLNRVDAERGQPRVNTAVASRDVRRERVHSRRNRAIHRFGAAQWEPVSRQRDELDSAHVRAEGEPRRTAHAAIVVAVAASAGRHADHLGVDGAIPVSASMQPICARSVGADDRAAIGPSIICRTGP